MRPRTGVRTLVILCGLYASGVVLYSELFLFTQNQSPALQTAKIFLAALHGLVFLLPAYLAQSPRPALRGLGYLMLAAYFLYVFFLTSYFAYFGFIPEVYAFGTGNLADLSEVAGHYFAQVFGPREVALILIAGAVFWALPGPRMDARWLMLLVLPAALFLASIANFGAPADSDRFGNVTVVRRFGLPAFLGVSFQEWAAVEDGYLAPETPYPGPVSRLLNTPGAGAAPLVETPAGIEHVVLIQIESLDVSAIGATLNGREVMPFVTGLENRCLSFSNFFTTKGAGGSSDAEFAVATGRLPSGRIASLSHADFSRIPTLYEHLAEAGVASYFAHNNHVGFYGRNLGYAQIPQVSTRFERPHEESDERAFATAALAAAMETPGPSFFYFFNFQSHGPYLGYAEATAEKLGLTGRRDIATNYLATMHEVDGTIAALFEGQRGDFEAGRSLFILTADHPSYLGPDRSQAGLTRVPALVCHRDIEGRAVDSVASTLDLHPTILQAFGLTGGDEVLGRSLFQGGAGVALLPNRQYLYRDGTGRVAAKLCGRACAPFADYTDQSLRMGR